MKESMIVIAVLTALLVGGCGLVQTTEDGQKIVTEKGAQVADTAAAIAEPAGALATSLSLFWPPAAVLGGLLAGAAGAWKKLRPQIIEAESYSAISSASGKAIVLAIEKLKEESPESWEKLKPYLEDFIASGGIIENFVRELRGLPDKI